MVFAVEANSAQAGRGAGLIKVGAAGVEEIIIDDSWPHAGERAAGEPSILCR